MNEMTRWIEANTDENNYKIRIRGPGIEKPSQKKQQQKYKNTKTAKHI